MKTLKYFLLTTLILILFALNLSAEQILTIQRDRAVMRSGAGSFYEVVKELPRGAKVILIAEEDDWFNVSYQSTSGYISPKVTQKETQRVDILSQYAIKDRSLSVSQHSMSAGVKGFGERFSKTYDGDGAFVVRAMDFNLNVKGYQEFRKRTYKGMNIKKIRKSISIPSKNVPDYYTVSQSGFGLGIASRIARLGVYEDEALTSYVNYVGNLVVEASDVYDGEFKFFILDIDNPNAYACPGGIVFITKGMLKMIDNEAELALVLGHEIAHCSRFHGVIELELREHHIASDEAFSDLDNTLENEFPDALDQETKDLIKDLDEELFKIYETLVQGRLEAYEEEADYIGMIYAARAGYSPIEFINLLQRLVNSGSLSNNEHYTAESNQKRIKQMTVNIRKIKTPSGLMTNRERYRATVRL